MRLAFLLPAALLATGCGVPDVHFADAGGSRDGTSDSPELDAPGEAGDDAPVDGTRADSGDAATEAPEYCKGDAGPPTDAGMLKCCGTTTGTVCSGTCNLQACQACIGICPWPSICCTAGSMGHCSPPDGGC